jgi:hypothetical protein
MLRKIAQYAVFALLVYVVFNGLRDIASNSQSRADQVDQARSGSGKVEGKITPTFNDSVK